MCTGKAIPFWIQLLPGNAMLGAAGAPWAASFNGITDWHLVTLITS